MKRIWPRILLWGSMLGLLGGALGFFFGAAAGLAAVVAVLAVAHVQNLRSINHFRRWLAAPESTEIPDGFGEWSRLYADMYRLRQKEAKAQQGLEDALARFRGATAAMPDGIVLLDQHNRIEWCNRAAEEMLAIGLRRDAGLAIAQLVRQPAFVALINGSAQEGGVVIRTPKEKIPLSVVSVPFNTQGRLLLVRDVSQMERATAILRDFVANVSHELRTPLTVIVGYLELLADGQTPSPDILARQYGLMLGEAKRMSRLVADLLVLSRLEASQGLEGDEVVNVPALLQTLAEEARALSAEKHEVSLNLMCDDGLTGAAEELHSAFGNLVSNAVRYTPPGGKITLHWEHQEGRPVFRVEDNGIGIPREHIPRLTERFYRVDKSRSSATGGTGLGLAIVKHVLLRHQAQLEVTSKPGQGSCFAVRFPASRRVVRASGSED